MATHSNGMSARQLEDQLGIIYKTGWLLAQKLRRSMVDPDRDLLEGVVEVDQTEIPFRVGDATSSPASPAKSWSSGRRGDRPRRRQAEAEAQGREISTPVRSLRLAVIADNRPNRSRRSCAPT